MSVSEQTPLITVNCDGSSSYDFPFPINDAEHCKVERVDPDTGSFLLTYGSDYTVVGTNGTFESGGTVNLTTAYTDGILNIYRETPLAQDREFPPTGPFPSTAVTAGLDQAVLILQEFRQELDRVIRAPRSDTGSELELPDEDTRPNTYLHFDSDGNIETLPGPVPRDYDPGYEYAADEIAQYNGHLYRSKQASNQNNTPSGGSTDSWWEELGLTGSLWNSDYIYSKGDVVSYEGTDSTVRLYESLQNDNESNTPPTPPATSSYWRQVETGGGVNAYFTVDESGGVSQGDVLTANGADTVGLADKGTLSKCAVVGLANAAAADTDQVKVITEGPITGLSGLTPGETYYLGDDGAILEGAAGIGLEDFRVKIGVAKSATELFVDIGPVEMSAYVDNDPVGSVRAWPTDTPPAGYLACNGQAVSRSVYAELFNVIGTDYGAGDGSTTFNLPDAREAALVGAGTRGSGVTSHDTYNVGEFKDDQMQGHQHNWDRPDGQFVAATARDSAGTREDGFASSGGTITGTWSIGDPVTDDTNGTPRTGTTTRGKRLGVTWIIKAVVNTSKAPVNVIGHHVGDIFAHGTDTPPNGALYCDGSAVSRTTYSELFNVIGETWGNGDGSTTFNIPDLREAAPVGNGTRGSGVTSHDTYNVGEFKDDQMQQITGEIWTDYNSSGSTGAFTDGATNSNKSADGLGTGMKILFDSANSPGARTGDVTRGKRVGVYYCIQAVEATATNIPTSGVRVVDADYTIQPDDAQTIYADASGGNVTITLPSLSGNLGRRITVRASADTGANTLTIQRAGSDVIADGSMTSVTLISKGDYWTFEAGPDQWELVAGQESSGEAVRWANGTQEERGEVSSWTQDGTSDIYYGNISFAFAFVNTTIRLISGFNYGSNYGTPRYAMGVTSLSTTSATIRQDINGASALAMAWHATGRWY